MPLKINLKQVEVKDLDLVGQIPAAELGVDQLDEVVHAPNSLDYRLTVQKLDEQILVRGHLKIVLRCECIRCLKTFDYLVDLPEWASQLPLSGEDKVEVTNDFVDLTPSVREDILLEFPQHPLCGNDCAGLPHRTDETANEKGASLTQSVSAWSELNKLKF